MAKKGVLLTDKDENFLYPQTILEMVTNKDQSATLDVLLQVLRENLESSIENTNLNVSNLRDELNALLSDETLSGEVRDAILEINSLLNSGSSDITSEVVTSIRQLKEDAVLHSEQNLTLSQKQQARQNIDAAGVSATYGDGLATLSYNGNAIFPETKGNQVKLSIGGNAEDAIKANGGNIEKERVRAIAREDEIAETLTKTKEKVDTFLADADTSEQALDKLKELQDYIKNDETSANQMLSDIAQNKQDINEKIGLVGSPTVENGVQSGTLGYKNQPLFPTTRDNKVFVQSKSRTLDVVINDIETDISKEETRAQQVEMYLESQKADKTGYYENLSVGVSDSLSGRGEATESEFSFRPSGGENKSIEDGTARINSIKGNSVVWNNLVRNRITHGSKYIVTKNDDRSYVVKLNPNFDGTTGNNWINDFTDKLENGHRYYFYIPYKVSGLSEGVTANLNLYAISDVKQYGKTGITNGIGSHSVIFDCDYTGSDNGKITPFIPLGELNAEFTIYGDRKCVDLTKMFNGVNVPTTVEEFESLYGNMPKEYNTGTIIDNHTTAIKSVGVNAWDEEWESGAYNIWNEIGDGNKVDINGYTRCKNHIPVIPNMTYSISSQSYASQYHIGFYDGDKNYIAFATFIQQTSGYRTFTTPPYCHYITFYTNHATYNHDICIHLAHTGYLNGRYFPYESQIRQLPTVEGGLKSAGTAYDEIRYNKGKDKWEHVQRVGSVDLGTLNWYYSPSTQANSRFVQNSLLPNCAKAIFSKIPNIISNKYTSVSGNTWLNVLTTDKSIGTGENTIGGVVGQCVVVVDKQYTDVATFKQAMQGVILYYELAEPVVTELDVDISPDYKVWDYGTEEAISEVLSTPVRINANYGFNAVGQITDNTELIKELLARVAVLEAQIAQQTNAAALVQDVDE